MENLQNATLCFRDKRIFKNAVTFKWCMEAFYAKKNLKTPKRERERQVLLLDESQKKLPSSVQQFAEIWTVSVLRDSSNVSSTSSSWSFLETALTTILLYLCLFVLPFLSSPIYKLRHLQNSLGHTIFHSKLCSVRQTTLHLRSICSLHRPRLNRYFGVWSFKEIFFDEVYLE